MTKINIVLLTHNRHIYLEKAIESVLNQSFKNFNLFILNNGSDINTMNVLNSLSDKRVSVIKNKKNSLEFINKAFSFLSEEYLIITHDDDEMEKNFLEEQINKLKLNDNIDLLACSINLIDEDSNNLRKVRPRILQDKIWKKGEYINQYMFSGNIIPCPTIIFKSSFLKKKPFKL